MRRASSSKSAFNDLSLRQVVTAVLLVIFTVANYAVRTHIHGSYISSGAASATPTLAAPSPAGPLDNDAQHCPLCQEFLSGGSFLTPAVIMVLPPATLNAAMVAAIARIAERSRSHSWQGRGPPALSR